MPVAGLAAWIAANSVVATTPTKFPRCTTSTNPGTARARVIDSGVIDTKLALRPLGRTTRPCSMPGTFTSWMKLNRAVTLSGRSARATG
jgi:hypothetical protein